MKRKQIIKTAAQIAKEMGLKEFWNSTNEPEKPPEVYQTPKRNFEGKGVE